MRLVFLAGVGIVALALFLVFRGPGVRGAPPGEPAAAAQGHGLAAASEDEAYPPVPAATIYRELNLDGEVVYEGSVPRPAKEEPELPAFPGPEPILASEDLDPLPQEMASNVRDWLRNLEVMPIDLSDLTGPEWERKNIDRFQHLRFVDDRMIVAVHLRGDPSGQDVDRLVDLYCELMACYNRCSKTYPESKTASGTLFEDPTIRAIDGELKLLKKQLVSAGHSVTATTAPVSSETIFALGGSR